MRHLRMLRYIDAVARAGSIRKAAEVVALTPSALNRAIQDFEEELGEQIFERLPRGVRLNAAGEIVIGHVRAQIADMERIRSQIADLSGLRSGHVGIACSQAVASHFLPAEIAAYRAEFPAVTFEVLVADHVAAQAVLMDFSADLALVFEPAMQADFQPIFRVDQRLHVVMRKDHPLAGRPEIRLRDCLDWELVLPDRSKGGRQMLDEALGQRSRSVFPGVVANSFEFLTRYVLDSDAISFQIAIGAPVSGGVEGLVARPLSAQDVRPGSLVLGQKRGRVLPVAAGRFVVQLARRLDAEPFGAFSSTLPGRRGAAVEPMPFEPQ